MSKVDHIRSIVLPGVDVIGLLDGVRRYVDVKPRGARGYRAGDILWVRETYAEVHPIAVQEGRFTRRGRAGIPALSAGGGGSFRVVYRTDGEVLPHWRDVDFPYARLGGPDPRALIEEEWGAYWESPVAMPVWASRLTLSVKAAERDGDHQVLAVEAHAENLDDHLARTGAYERLPDLKIWPGLPRSPAYQRWLASRAKEAA